MGVILRIDGMASGQMVIFVGIVSELFEDLQEFVDGVGTVIDIGAHLIDNIYYHLNTNLINLWGHDPTS